MKKQLVNLLMVEDHPLIRQGVKLMLETEDEFEFNFTEVISGEEAIELLKLKKFDIILLDISLPNMTGIDVIRQLNALENFNTPVIFQTMHLDRFIVKEAIDLNARGYVLKIEDPHVLIRAIATVLDGGTFFSDSVSELIKNSLSTNKNENLLNKLSSREEEVLILSTRGFSCKEIGAHLKISNRTVEGHRQRIFNKLDIDSVAKLIVYANNKGYK
jgi:DNA-binding NarL/FixJ family response regulator